MSGHTPWREIKHKKKWREEFARREAEGDPTLVYSGGCPSCGALVMWNGGKERGPHICFQCTSGEDYGLTKYEDSSFAKGE